MLKKMKILILLAILLTLGMNTWIVHQLSFHDRSTKYTIETFVQQPSPVGEQGQQLKPEGFIKPATTESALQAHADQQQSNHTSQVSIRKQKNIIIKSRTSQQTSHPPTMLRKSSPMSKTSQDVHPAVHKGYVIGVSFWDQQTFSTHNLVSLQCWAGYLNMVVAEPFLIRSYFQAPIAADSLPPNETVMKLSDVYDLNHWNSYGKQRNFAPFLEWETFLEEAPRNVILVYVSVLTKACALDRMRKEYSQFLQVHNFVVVREVCATPPSSGKMSLKNFTEHIFGGYSPEHSTVIFQEWKVIDIASIAVLEEGGCRLSHLVFEPIAPSKRAVEDMEKYIKTHLKGNLNYVALMMRTEWIIMNKVTQMEHIIPSCINKTVQLLDAVQRVKGINSTFFAIDVGKYGSKTLKKYIDSDFMRQQAVTFYQRIYGSSNSFDDWESAFEELTQTNHAGYIAYLQKLIATRAKCIILIGNGTYQKHAFMMYRAIHGADLCFAIGDTKCNISSSKGFQLPSI